MTDEKRFRTEIPNIIDDLGLDPHERALYVHYKRACGGNDCEWVESIRITGQRTKMSFSRASMARKSLAERGLIRLISKGNDGTAVRIVNIWDLNTAFYQHQERPDIDGWTVEQLKEWVQGVHNMNTIKEEGLESEPEKAGVHNTNAGVHNTNAGVHNMNNKKEPLKKEPIKNLSPNGAAPKKPKGDTAKAPTESQAMFKALVDLCKYDLELLTEKDRGRLNQFEKRMRTRQLKPDDIREFESWWYSCDWRGQKDQAPTLDDLYHNWRKFEAFKSGEKGGSNPQSGAYKNGHKPQSKNQTKQPGPISRDEWEREIKSL